MTLANKHLLRAFPWGGFDGTPWVSGGFSVPPIVLYWSRSKGLSELPHPGCRGDGLEQLFAVGGRLGACRASHNWSVSGSPWAPDNRAPNSSGPRAACHCLGMRFSLPSLSPSCPLLRWAVTPGHGWLINVLHGLRPTKLLSQGKGSALPRNQAWARLGAASSPEALHPVFGPLSQPC